MNERITLKGIKHAAFASEETHCFQATVYFDNKKVGTVSNEGRGGCDYEYPTDKKGWTEMVGYIKTLPPVVSDNPDLADEDGTPFSMRQSLENICCDIVNDWLVVKSFKRDFSTKLMFTKTPEDREVYQYSLKQRGYAKPVLVDHFTKLLAEKHPQAVILNNLNDSDLRSWIGEQA